MKRWHAVLPNWATITSLTLLVTLSVFSSYFGISLVTKAMAFGIIPLLLLAYFHKQKVMANIFFVIFILFFSGMVFSAFEQLNLSSKLSESCFLGAYALLIFVMIGRLGHVKFERLVSWYLVVISLVSTYFMYILFAALEDSFQDSVTLILAVSKTIALLVMAFLAFAIYLSKETSQSIIFLTVVCCFVFSDVLSFITSIYIHFWLFEGIQNILQGAGLLLFCVYVYNHHAIVTDGISRSKASKLVSQSRQMSVQS